MFYIWLLIAICIAVFIFADWHGRIVFLYDAYPKTGRGKTGRKIKRHYKSHWKLWQRLLWIPALKEDYDLKYQLIPILTYIHAILNVITIICFLIGELVLKDEEFYRIVLVVTMLFGIVKFRYQSGVARSRKPRNKRRN